MYGLFVGLDWMQPGRRRARATSFGPAATLYDQVRPTYPPAAVEWTLQPLGIGRWRVADIGAGTGIMTRVIASLGHGAVAIEPDERMRQRLAATTPGVAVIGGGAEALPLADASVDAAVAAQAYHWFDSDRANAELGRVIRRGGVFAAIWNDRDDAADWVNEYSRIVEGDRGPDGSGADSGRAKNPSFGNGFGPVEYSEFRHAVRHTPESLVALLRSRSYFITASPERRNALERDVRNLACTHPDLAGRDTFDLPYLAVVYRAIRT
jgi:SAM-dependent methyltransferase